MNSKLWLSGLVQPLAMNWWIYSTEPVYKKLRKRLKSVSKKEGKWSCKKYRYVNKEKLIESRARTPLRAWTIVEEVTGRRASASKILLITSYRHVVDSVQIDAHSGYIERGESPEYSAIRELKEERGYSLAIEQEIECPRCHDIIIPEARRYN